MEDEHGTQHYSLLEEKTNIISHAIGLGLSIIALLLMVVKASRNGDAWAVVGAAIFGLSLVALYAASTIYHSATDPWKRARLRIIDHATIYVLIAGTYTPFALVTLKSSWVGWTVFGVSWSMALTGIILKLFHTGKYNALSTLMYIVMGWVIIFAIKPMIDSLSYEGIVWLFGGGVAYTTGAILYSIKAVLFNHAIFHIFVLLGSLCHFISVYLYVLK